MFYTIENVLEENECSSILRGITLEDSAKGRQIAIIVDTDNGLVPLVRTTNKTKNAVQVFKPIHYELVKKMKRGFGINHLSFNNAMIERYSKKYTSMSFHSDQSLDLKEDSYICIYTVHGPITLTVKRKDEEEERSFSLGHNSAILFSVGTNSKYVHKLAFDKGDEWTGLTFRMSKTFLSFSEGYPIFVETNERLILKDHESDEKKEFCVLKKKENELIEFQYPNLNYTINPSDCVRPSWL